MINDATPNYERIMEDATMTANTYMREAIRYIDMQLGEGYAKKHPELIGAFMQTCASDYACMVADRNSKG